MNFEKVLKILSSEFQKNKIDFALIGGQALFFANIFRTTMDIDFIVLLKQFDIIDAIMKQFGYKLIHKTQDVANYYSDLIEFGQVDFLFAHRKYALQMLKRAEYKEMFGLKIKVLKPEDLIGLKIQSSYNDPQRYHQDVADIEQLIQKNYNKIDLEIVREYFELFDREDEFNLILKKLK